MSDLQLMNSKIRGGIWHGILSGGKDTPDVEVRHLDQLVPDVSVHEEDGVWRVKVPIPADAISEGIQNFAVFNKADGAILADFTLIAGEALGDDIRAEVELLRAELDMLKRAFRRHCVETS